MDVLNIIGSVCSIVSLLIALLTLNKVSKIEQNYKDNEINISDKSKNINSVFNKGDQIDVNFEEKK